MNNDNHPPCFSCDCDPFFCPGGNPDNNTPPPEPPDPTTLDNDENPLTSTCTLTCNSGYVLNIDTCECVADVKDPCVEEAKNKIKQITEIKFSGFIDIFNNVNSPFKVNIFTGSLGGNPNLAHTVLSDIPRTYNIVLNEDFPNATSLSLNSSILHEYVHAYFNSLYDDWKNNGNSHAYDDYPVLKSFYIDGTYWGNSQDAQHEQIAASFINNIATALKELEPGLTDQYYKDMAWGTLQGTAVYNSDTYLIQTEKDRIGKERSSEKNNQQVGDNVPKGKPCIK